MKKFLFLILSVVVFIMSCSQGDTGPAGTIGEDIAILEFQEEVSPSHTYIGTMDAYLEGGSYSISNYGTSDYLFIGRYINIIPSHNGAERFLLKFDLTGFQNQKIKVKKAEITLYSPSVSVYPTGTTMTVTPYEITDEWIEDEVTWDDKNSSSTWTSAGGDYSGVAGNSVKLNDIDKYYIFNINSSIVQKWIDTPEKNHGLIFISDTESIQQSRYFGFYSKDYTGNEYRRPKLTIYYTLQ